MDSQKDYLSNAHPIELVIFDCDGVLIDSEIVCAGVLERELQGMGLPIDCNYALTHFLGHSYSSMAQHIQQNFQFTLPANFKHYYRDTLLKVFEHSLRSTPGLEQILSTLGVSRCIATSSSPTRTRHALEFAGLSDYFDANVFTASEVRNGKPAPDLFLHAARKMKVEPSRCLVIEDSLAGITAAIAAGMSVWRYIGGSHLDAENDSLPQEFSQIPVFAAWDCFYTMAPNLQKTDIEERKKDDN